uniref:Uncharacterized protein n=1 Tax=Pristionchus pacificus TaxID=54126 RepID=A0A2A6CHE0_PRIPA|eukprot:PDM77488.1 hypothetical protein PRIPAC_34355 [Pristionchus pacificus]
MVLQCAQLSRPRIPREGCSGNCRFLYVTTLCSI